MRRLRGRSGMTLVESTFALMLTVMICTALWGVSTFVQRLRAQDRIQIQITDKTRMAMERILWGFTATNDPNAQRDGVREAATFQVQDGGARLTFTDSNAVARQIRLNGTSIEYTEPGLPQGWVTLYAPSATAAASTTLKFSVSNNAPDVVVVELVIGQRVRERWFYASLQSKVMVRN